jgi:DNA polymerase III alpha subunit
MRSAISSRRPTWRRSSATNQTPWRVPADLADRLHYSMADLGYRFPDYPVPAGETQTSFLRKIADVGARERYRPFHDKARAQVARELDLIEKLELAGYFLIVWDIVNFCRQHDILVQGRGSAANSAVCYSLGITAVDPVGMDLLFERFLSKSAASGPTSTSTCRAATGANRSSSTSTRSTAGWARR